jgi:hypothetical protein
MAREIIQNGTVANDGTGDNLRVTADKINRMFGEMYSVFQFNPNGDLVVKTASTADKVYIGDPDSSHLVVPGSASGDPITIGKPSLPILTAPTVTGGEVKLGNPGTGNTTVGNTGTGNTTVGNTGNGSSTFGNSGGGDGASTFGNTGSGSNGNSQFGNGSGTAGTSGFGNAGTGNSGFGNSGNGNSTFGNSGNGNSTFGNSGTGTNTFVTSEDPWQVLFSNGSKQIDSSEWIKVSADSADLSGKSLHLGASTYDLGFGNSLKQRAIYFTDPSITGSEAVAFPTKRVASIRWYDNSAFGKGLFLSPDYNYNDTAFPNRGVGIWRHIENGITNTKVNLNAECDGPGTHGVQIGRGAIAFFQDIPAYAIPEQREEAVKGKTYIVLPGIHTDDGSVHVGQVSSNPYKNRESESKGIPYWSLGHKPSTQLIENSPAGGIEKSERTPGSEVIVWTIQNRVGINNTNPAYELDVTGSVNLTGQFLVDASAGTSGQVLTSAGSSSSPTWANIPPVNDLAGGVKGSVPYQNGANDTVFLAPGTDGQVLKISSGGVPEWGAAAGSLSISSDSSTNVNYNLALTTASSGSITAQVVDAGKLKYNPSIMTGTLFTPNLVLSIPGTPLVETGYKESHLYFRNPSGVNVSTINVYDDFYPGNIGYFEVYTRNGSNEQFANLNFNGYGAFGFDDAFGNQGDVVVGYGSTGKSRMARMGTGTAQLVSALPAASTAGAGARGFVTDATASTFYSVVSGGGSIGVPVFSDGTNWRIG